MNWLEHVEKWKDCKNCSLSEQRSNICLARGTIPADILIIGEAPGATEDTLGVPFKGPAGQLLDQIINRALIPITTYVLTNLVACYPREAKTRGDNQPERSEILECRPRLVEFVNIAQPRLIVRVGKLVQSYCNFDTSIPFCDIDHPAYILRMPSVQQRMAAERCIVTISTAWHDVVNSPQPYKQWGIKDATVKTHRQHLQDIYGK